MKRNYRRPYKGRDKYDRMIRQTIICVTAITVIVIVALCVSAAKAEAEEQHEVVEESPAVTLIWDEPTPDVVIEVPELVEVPMTPLGEYKVVGYDPYCTHCCPRGDGITASGGRLPSARRVPLKGCLGTKLYISGLGEYVVEDRA